jgi:hypothetical protein
VQTARLTLLDRTPGSFRDLASDAQLDAREDQQQLLTADPVEQLERAQRLAQGVGHVLEHGVALRMAVCVVDALEFVEVKRDQR